MIRCSRFLSLLMIGAALVGRNEAVRASAADPGRIAREARPAKEIVRWLSQSSGKSFACEAEIADDKVTTFVPASASWELLKRELPLVLDAEWVIQHRGMDEVEVLRATSARKARRERITRAKALHRQQLADELRKSLQWRIERFAGDGGGAPFRPVDSPEGFALAREIPAAVFDQAASDPNPPLDGTNGNQAAAVSISGASLSPAGQAALSHVVARFGESISRQFPEAAQRVNALVGSPGRFSIQMYANDSHGLGGSSMTMVIVYPHGTPMVGLPIATARGFGAGAGRGTGSRKTPGETRAPDPREQKMITLAAGSYRYDHLLTLMARAGGFALVSDYFTRSKPIAITGKPYRIGELLDTIDAQIDTEHEWHGSALCIKSPDADERAWEEPVAAVTDRLEACISERAPSLADLLFAARLSNSDQLAMLRDHMTPMGQKLPAMLVTRLSANRRMLDALALSSESERRLARSSAGLVLERLPSAQRQAWSKAVAAFGLTDVPALRLRLVEKDPVPFTDWPDVPAITLGAGDQRRSLWVEGRVY